MSSEVFGWFEGDISNTWNAEQMCGGRAYDVQS